MEYSKPEQNKTRTRTRLYSALQRLSTIQTTINLLEPFAGYLQDRPHPKAAREDTLRYRDSERSVAVAGTEFAL